MNADVCVHDDLIRERLTDFAPTDAVARKWLASWLAGEGGARKLYLACRNDKVVAFILLQVSQPSADVLYIYCAPEWRGKGIGAQLLQAPVVKLGLRILHIEVAASNGPAQSLYKRFGFRLDRVLKDYYSVGEDAYAMSWRQPAKVGGR